MMRLHEVEKGDGFFYQTLISFISVISGMRLPDAARIVMYHQDFYGKPMTSWTHAAMRGVSSWSVGERELMAAMVAKWNTCPFCIDAHGSIASLELGKPLVTSVLKDSQQASISDKLKVTLVYLEKLTRSPGDLSVADVQTVFDHGISPEDLEDATAVAALFSITVHCANAFNFAMLGGADSARAAKRMLKQGYSMKKDKNPGHPDHRVLAEELHKRVFESPGKTELIFREAIAQRVTGGPPLKEPYDELVLQIREASYKVTDKQVKKVVDRSGSEKAAFEIMTTACVGIGLDVWDKGYSTLEEIDK